jgi:hypothetical protein
LKVKALEERAWKEARAGGKHASKRHGKYKICDERFYSYWVPSLVELISPDWF